MHTATSSDKIEISSEKQTEELAERIQEKLKLGDIVFLYGEIGVGKTTFVKYFINELQKTHNLTPTEVTSPTFGLLNEYKIKDIRIKHYDLFRINNKKETYNLDIFEIDNKSITLIEWPQLITNTKKIKFIKLTFIYSNDLADRSVEIKL